MNTINANPGQTVRLVVQTLDGYTGARIDGYVPVVRNVYFPDLSLASGYPMPMVKLDTGLYIHGLSLPSGSTSLGTYIANTYFVDNTGRAIWEVFQIQVSRPFGNSSVMPL